MPGKLAYEPVVSKYWIERGGRAVECLYSADLVFTVSMVLGQARMRSLQDDLRLWCGDGWNG